MKCPYCNDEMKQGYIQSARQIFWGEKKHKIFFLPENDEEFSLSEGIFNGSFGEAYWCKKCNKIIMEL